MPCENLIMRELVLDNTAKGEYIYELISALGRGGGGGYESMRDCCVK